jgi:outer membrane protein assembly factor BamE
MKYFILTIVPLFFLNACAIEQENRMKAMRHQIVSNPSVPNEIRAAIRNNQIMVGMTKEQVLASWGQPCGLCYGTRRSSTGDTWEYNPGETTSLGIGAGTYLYFDTNGILRYWSSP